ncbi:FAD-containing monooxygenase EthA [Enemella evansiae]|uniref:FAD-containing monooxygenase EthA n=1 Tax=Enemella evansiae TaxID=2016499 RepID=A0A255GGH0_9ACTN|nr:NAD(P)/FAD-dependent oxidoreductase [Enemella evansiae]OYO13403.1 FAD-containing monooxygenase EthA [Enemella evansiae]
MENTGTGRDRVDVLIVGAGLSGIGVAHYLQDRLPHKEYLILEARDTLGGTWDLFRYPGIRSDSDLSTFSYEFRPWQSDQAIAPAGMILDYLRETAAEEGIDTHIRCSRRVTELSWSSAEGCWTARVQHTDTGDWSELTATWVFCAGGYYRYDQAYTPSFEGTERFEGTIVHPQFWPEDLEYAGKQIVVIGSGATAMTLVPALAETAGHVTMVQRTPTYVLPLPSVDRAAVRTRRRFAPDRAHAINRARNIRRQRLIWSLSRRFPGLVRRFIRRVNRHLLPEGYPVEVDFNPPYDPWDQRLCIVPDGDLFRAIRAGSASIVTDRVRTFTERGVQLESGRELPADLIITATGLNLQLFGGIRVRVDGNPVDFSEHVAYRGLMLNDIPNFAYAVGYTNASWTLKIGLLGEYFARLLAHMDAEGWAVCRAELPADGLDTLPLLDFGAGYVQRSLASLPRQGDRGPWRTSTDYRDDVKLLRHAPVQDGSLRFEPARAAHLDTAAIAPLRCTWRPTR